MSRRTFVVSVFLPSLVAFGIACGGDVADERATTGAPASSADAGTTARDAATSTRSDAATVRGPEVQPTQTTPTGPALGCPNGRPNPGALCTGEGAMCNYGEEACVCMAFPGAGGSSQWACGLRLPDGGAGCPPSSPAPAGSCSGFSGSRCDLGLSVCVCNEAQWMCSDG